MAIEIAHHATEEEERENDYPPTHYCRSDEIIELRRKLKRMYIEIGHNDDDDVDDEKELLDELREETEAAFRMSSFLSTPISNPTANPNAVMDESRFRPRIQRSRKRAKRVPQHGFCVVPGAKKPALLWYLLKRVKKAVVFFSSDYSVDFFGELLTCLNMRCYRVHRFQQTLKRCPDISEFHQAEEGILLAENNFVDCRRFRGVNLMVQYDPLLGPQEYLRLREADGRPLILVDPEETEFICELKAAKLHLDKYKFKEETLADMPHHLEKLVADKPCLSNLARNAYWKYLLIYKRHPDKEDIFNYLELDLKAAAGSFCLPEPPKVSKDIEEAT